MSEHTMTFRVGLTRRYNLGDYQHIEGTVEVAGPIPAGQTPEEAIAAAQAMLARRLAKETLLGQANRPAPAQAPAERPQASAPAPADPPPPAPAAEPAVSAADLRMRLKAALAANPQLIPVMQAFLHERGARGLQSAPDALLPELAQVMNVKVTP
jgi:hypothetical protein